MDVERVASQGTGGAGGVGSLGRDDRPLPGDGRAPAGGLRRSLAASGGAGDLRWIGGATGRDGVSGGDPPRGGGRGSPRGRGSPGDRERRRRPVTRRSLLVAE